MVLILDPQELGFEQFEQKLEFFNTTNQSVLINNKSFLDSASESLKEVLNCEKLLWISSSGSFQKKLIGLSSRALFNSASSVIEQLKITEKDIWAISLPLHHIASVSVLYRHFLSKCHIELFLERWNALDFCKFLLDSQSTICSLVPTQVFDLVHQGCKPAPELRVVLVGGAHLDRSLYLRARELGWPLLPTYGLTECCSQVACASLESLDNKNCFPSLKVLPHLKVTVSETGTLSIQGTSLLSKSILLEQNQEFSVKSYTSDDSFSTQDIAEIQNEELIILGRSDRCVKIKGSFVQLQLYEDVIAESCKKYFIEQGFIEQGESMPIIIASALPNLRDGFEIIISYHGPKLTINTVSIREKINNFLLENKSKLPFIKEFKLLESLPLLDNRKINYKEVQMLVTDE